MARAYTEKGLNIEDFTEADYTSVYLAFRDAFQHYNPKVKLTISEFRNKFHAYYHTDKHLSVQLRYNKKLAGFCMVTSGQMNHRSAGWISAMGIRNGYQGRGWSHFLLRTVIDNTRKARLEKLYLEVQTWNDQAINLFSSYDFKVGRKLASYKLYAPYIMNAFQHEIKVWPGIEIPFENVELYNTSFQESLHFIQKENKHHSTLVIHSKENCPAGYLIMDSDTGRIRHIFILPEQRNRGLGSSLVSYAAQLKKNLTLINVDTDDEGMCNFLHKLGFRREMEQYEMIRILQ
jgi:ribosomal protein S18 acetylase RimI-like enzyme